MPPPSPLPPLLLGISTKAYFNHAETLNYAHSLVSLTLPLPSTLLLFFIPSFLSLTSCAEILTSPPSSSTSSTTLSTPIALGAQDCHFSTEGAATGSILAPHLASIGCTLVELGHAERRAPPLSEDDSLIKRKVSCALKAGLLPLVCVGEKRAPSTHTGGVVGAFQEVWAQVEIVINAVTFAESEREWESKAESDRKIAREKARREDAEAGYGEEEEDEEQAGDGMEKEPEGGAEAGPWNVVFAYEPVWAIGKQKPADGEHVRGVMRLLKRKLKERKWLDRCRVLYGGSAGPGVWEKVGAGSNGVDGLFLGRFAHDIKNLEMVVEEMTRNLSQES